MRQHCIFAKLVWIACFLVTVRAQTYGWITEKDANGFTVIPKPSPDSRVIYVSSSSGNDDNNGTIDKPFQTIKKASSMLRANYPDHMYLKRGDVFKDEKFGIRAGRSPQEPAVISSYGEGTDRPKIVNGGISMINFPRYGWLNFTMIIGLHFYQMDRDYTLPSFNATGYPKGTTAITYLRPAYYLLIEDNFIQYYGVGIVIEGAPPGYSYVTVRRNVVVDSYNPWDDGHSQCIFTFGLANFLIEENVFDHCGWTPNGFPNKTTPTIFNHDLYIHDSDWSTNTTVQGNIIARASSHGLQLRPGGVIQDNLFLKNSINFFNAGNGLYPHNVIANNIVLNSKNIGDQPRGWGTSLFGSYKTGEVTGNILAHSNDVSGGSHAFDIQASGDQLVNFSDNILYDWNGKLLITSGNSSRLTFANNVLEFPKWDEPIVTIDQYTQQTFSGNSYAATSNATSTPFNINGKALSFSDFEDQIGEKGGVLKPTQFVDPSVSIESYNSDCLQGKPTLEAFLGNARTLSKSNWNPKFTAAAVMSYIRSGFTKGPSGKAKCN